MNIILSETPKTGFLASRPIYKCKCFFLFDFRWIGVRLEMLGNVIVLLATIFALISNELNGAEVGLSITYAVQVGATFYQFYKLMMVDLNNVLSFVQNAK